MKRLFILALLLLLIPSASYGWQMCYVGSTPSCGLDGNVWTETFEGATEDNTWYSGGTTSDNCATPSNSGYCDDYALPGLPGVCDGSYGLRVHETGGNDNYRYSDLGSDISNGWTNNVDITYRFYIPSTSSYDDADEVMIGDLSDGTETWNTGAGYLYITYLGGTYMLKVGGAASVAIKTDLPTDTYFTVKVHYDVTAASSTVTYNAESPVSFTRNADAPRYVRLGCQDVFGKLDATNTCDVIGTYATVNNP